MKVENTRVSVEITDEDIKELVKQKTGVDLEDYSVDDYETYCGGFQIHFIK